MNCTKCGAPINPAYKFCSKCGTPIPKSAPGAPVPPVAPAGARPAPGAPVPPVAPAGARPAPGAPVPPVPPAGARPAPGAPVPPVAPAGARPAPGAPVPPAGARPAPGAPVPPAGARPPMPGGKAPAKKSPILMIIAILLLVVSIAGLVYSLTDNAKIVGKWTAKMGEQTVSGMMIQDGSATMEYPIFGQQKTTATISVWSEKYTLNITSAYSISNGVITYGKESVTVKDGDGKALPLDQSILLNAAISQSKENFMTGGRLNGASSLTVNVGEEGIGFVRTGGLAFYMIVMIASGVLAAIGVLLLILGLKPKKASITPLAPVGAPVPPAGARPAPGAPVPPVAPATPAGARPAPGAPVPPVAPATPAGARPAPGAPVPPVAPATPAGARPAPGAPVPPVAPATPAGARPAPGAPVPPVAPATPAGARPAGESRLTSTMKKTPGGPSVSPDTAGFFQQGGDL